MYQPIHITQGIKYFVASMKQKLRGPKRYAGNADEICKKIVKDCWNGRYFQVSPCHYTEFWARDFGYSVESLLKLGYRKEVLKTLAYALEKYSRTGIKTTIARKPFSFPNLYSPDSVALIFHALRVAKADDLVDEYEEFLQQEADKFAKVVLQNGRVRINTLFSGMRDYAKRKSSCYDHCMSILMARETKKLGFEFPYTEKELVKGLEAYWIGYYRDDRGSIVSTGDANTLPYWLGVGKKFKQALNNIQGRLDQPFPLAYSDERQRMIGAEIFVPNWETKTVWPFLGFLWMHAVKKHNPRLAKEYKKQYKAIIEKYKTLYEAYTRDAKPYKSLFYHADEGMLWAAMYLTV